MGERPAFRAYNFRQVTDRVATSGVVPEDEFAGIAKAGFRTVINLLPDDNQYALANEASVVSALGMQYVHIPIDIEAPTRDDFARFESAMEAVAGESTWVHCAANWRVSAFVGLYGRLRWGWSASRAEAHMRDIWEPTTPWTDLIDRVMREREAK